MALYHEISKDALDSVLQDGLKRGDHSEKSDNLIAETDELLDHYRPTSVRSLGIARQSSVYAYFGNESAVIDVDTGKAVPLAKYAASKNALLLRLDVNAIDCFVSDLDLYDAVKTMIRHGHVPPEVSISAYWESVVPLANYRGGVHRPEIIITRDVLPEQIHVVE